MYNLIQIYDGRPFFCVGGDRYFGINCNQERKKCMKILKPGAVRPAGELAVRAGMSAVRLEAPMYSTVQLYDNISKDWQGDFEGRVMLGQALLAMTTGRTPAYLDDSMEELVRHLNEKGYLGPILTDGSFNEQNMSGHGWLLRALCEYYNLRGYEWIKDIVRGIVNNLFLPAKPYYDSYPILPGQRQGGGDMSGSNSGQVGVWRLSTDTGCAYIPIDGVTAAYALTGDEEIGALAEEMIRCFLKIDVTAISAQTHATLTACRGMLRMVELGRTQYLDEVKRLFALYCREGMTPSYENCNWFGRPEWTEPCAVIDSFMVAMQLFAHTDDTDYLDIAQRILYNGIFREQRPNGGFGCQSCATDGVLRIHCNEAYWCCTMRGGEGLSRVAQYSYMLYGNTIVAPYLGCSRAEIPLNGDIVTIHQRSDYPYAGCADFTIEGLSGDGVSLAVYIPAEHDYRTFALHAGTNHIELRFDISFHSEPAAGVGKGTAYYYGNLLLGAEEGASIPADACPEALGDGAFSLGGVRLEPLCGVFRMEEPKAESYVRRILF